MKIDMKKWLGDMVAAPKKKALPILSFPSSQLMGVTVRELTTDAALQAEGMARVAARVPSAAAVSLMDLSVEAECFGAQVHATDDEVPTIIGHIIDDETDLEKLAVPVVGSARSGMYVEAVRMACEKITDRPVLAGMIGPYSLAGRLMDVTEIMYACFDDPDLVHGTLEKATEFLTAYALAYKAAGANGIVMAEPLAGLLSPALAEEFSCDYVKRIVDAVQDDDFAVIYHNCGDAVGRMIPEILETGCMAYHFGNAVDIRDILPQMPENMPCMGNIDPAGEFAHGTPESIRSATMDLMKDCTRYPGFVISSGCDIPPAARWENIDAFFKAVEEFYA